MRFSRLVLLTAFAAACAPSSKPAASGKVSEFGRYEGYGEPQYSAWVRTSAYVTVRDGTRLAVDIIRPAVDGKPVDAKFPVIWTH